MKEKTSSSDSAQLKSPLVLGLFGMKQLLQCYNVGTEEIKQTLLNECEVIIECKVCRSLYRGVANFLAHKRQYCKSNFARTDLEYGFQDFVDRGQGKPQRVQEKIVSLEVNHDEHTREEEVVATEETSSKKSDSEDPEWQPPLLTRKRKQAAEKDDRQTKCQKVNESEEDSASPDGLNGITSESSSGGMNCFRLLFTKGNGNTHKCKICHIVCQSSESLKQHIKKHLDARSFHECVSCSKLFIDLQVYKDHLRKNHSLSEAEFDSAISLPKIKKFVVNGNKVYDIPSVGGSGGSVKKKDDKSDAQRSDEVVEIDDEGPKEASNGNTKLKPTSPASYSTLRSIMAKSIENIKASSANHDGNDENQKESDTIEIDLT